VLRYWSGLSEAETLGVSRGTVNTCASVAPAARRRRLPAPLVVAAAAVLVAGAIAVDANRPEPATHLRGLPRPARPRGPMWTVAS